MEFCVRLLNLSLLIFLLSLSTQVDAQHARRNRVTRNPSPRPPKVRFTSGNNALRIPFELSGNLVLLQATVNNSAPLWFILDTGATDSVIDSQLAKTLSLKVIGRTLGTGGAGTATALIFRGTTLKLRNVEAVNLTLYGFPLDSLSAPFGRRISGVIGNDILKQLVVEVDYVSQVLNFYEPASYQYSGAGVVIPITLEGYPFVRARITLDGRRVIEGKFEIDSGATNAIMFNTPFVDRNKLLEGISKSNQVRTGGLGGSAVAFSGRLKSMSLGSLQLENLIARFSLARRGDDNVHFSEPYEADMTGLDLATEGDDFSVVVVNEVEKDSPGAEAGIEGKDVITAIDGRPLKEFTITQIRKMFMLDGKEYLISLKRGQKELQTKLRLRRLI